MNFPQNLKSNKACRILTQDAAGFIILGIFSKCL